MDDQGFWRNGDEACGCGGPLGTTAFSHRGCGCASAADGSQTKNHRTGLAQGTEIAMVQVTYLDAIRQALLEAMDRDPAVWLVAEDVGVYGGPFNATAGLLERFGGERLVD